MDLSQRVDMTETIEKVEREVEALVAKTLPVQTPLSDIEESIAAVFGRRFQMMWERVEGEKPNFKFYETKTWVERGPYRGCARVMRIRGDMESVSPEEAMKVLWGDPKGMVLIGFNDVAAFIAADRNKYTVIASRRGLYE
jgi:hypothetical protein